MAVTTTGTPAREGAVDRANELLRRAAQSGDPATARDLLAQAIVIDPDNAEAHFRLGGLLLGSDPAQARIEYQVANRLDPTRYGDEPGAMLKER